MREPLTDLPVLAVGTINPLFSRLLKRSLASVQHPFKQYRSQYMRNEKCAWSSGNQNVNHTTVGNLVMEIKIP